MKQKISLIVAILLVITSIFAIVVVASSGTSSNTDWNYDESTKTLTISPKQSTNGKMQDYQIDLYVGASAPWISIRSEIKNLVIEAGVTYIGNYAFKELTSLKAVFIPEGCAIGAHAFDGCTSLEKLSFFGQFSSVGDYAFVGCSKLNEVVFVQGNPIIQPADATIGESAFEGCVSLEAFEIPTNVTEIGKRAFAFCYKLAEVTFENEGTKLEYIGDGAFRNCYALKEFNFVENESETLEVGADLFNYCKNLETVYINETSNLVNIGDGMFRNCESLQTVVCDAEVEKIGEYAFQDTTSLDTFGIPDSVTEIGRFAFKNSGVVSIALPEAVTVIPQGCFLDAAKLSSISFGVIEYVLDDAFQNCVSLDNIAFEEGLIGIGKSAFYGCEGLADFSVPETVEYIRDYAFARSGIKELYVPSSNTSFGKGVIGIYSDYKTTTVDQSVKIYASANSLARFYAEELGLAFEAFFSDDTPGIVLQYKLDAEAENDLSGYEKIYIGGTPISEFDIIYQDKDLGDGKCTKATREGKNTILTFVEEITGSSINDIKLKSAGDSDKEHHIYLLNNAVNIGSLEGLAGTRLDGLETTVYKTSSKDGYFVKYGSEGFEYLVANGNLYIFGGYQRGGLYGAMEIVEKFFGVAHLYGEEYTVEEQDIINIENGSYDFQLPIIADRDSRTYSYDDSDACMPDDQGATTALRINSIKHSTLEKNQTSGFGVGYFGSAHSFGDLIDVDDSEQPCFTDKDTLYETIMAAGDVLYDKEFNEKWYYYEDVAVAVSQMDNANYDAADLAYAKKNGLNLSDLIVNFNNRVAEGIAEGHPWYNEAFEGAKVWSLAYMDARIAPVNAIPRSNVETCVAYYGCQNHLITSDECTYTTFYTDNTSERENLEKWFELSENMYVWYYPVTYTWQMAPMPVLFNMREDVRYLADNNVYGIYFENQYGDDTIQDGYSYEMLTAYMQARLMWNPYMTEEEFMAYTNEFIEYYYGSDVEDVYDVILMDNEAGDEAGCFVNQFSWPFDTFDYDYMGENYGTMIEKLNKALEAEDLTDDQIEHLEKLKTHILFLGLSAAHEKEYVKGDEETRAKYVENYDDLVEILNKYSMDIGYTNSYPAVGEQDYDETPYDWYGLPTLHRVAYSAREIEQAIKDMTVDNVTIADKEALMGMYRENSDLYAIVGQYPAHKDAVMATLVANSKKIPELLDAIYRLERIKAINDAFESYDLATVKSTDLEDLEAILDDIAEVLEFEDIKPEEVTNLEEVKNGVDELIGKIAEVKNTREQMLDAAAGINNATITSDSLDLLIALEADMRNMLDEDNLTFAERIELNNEYHRILDALRRATVYMNSITFFQYTLNTQYTKDNVTPEAVAYLEGIKDEIAAMMRSANTSKSEYHVLNALYVKAGKLIEAANAKAVKETVKTSFADVDETAWYAADVQYVYNFGIMNGVGDGKFDPKGTTTRAMVATVLYRLAGSPAVTAKASFTDVEAGEWYSNAIAWAEANGIVNGYGDGKFGTFDEITREQLCAVLYRFTAKLGKDTRFGGNLDGYTDTADINAYALEAFGWASDNGIMTGRDNKALDPQASATRGELAAVLHRFCTGIFYK